jgi:hypothetical protein
MKPFTFLLFFWSVAGTCVSAQWSTESFTISWADGYQRVSEPRDGKIQLVAEDRGIAVTMTVTGHHLSEEAEFQKLRASFTAYATDELPKIAKRHGSIVIPLQRNDLPSGTILFVLGEHQKSAGKFGLFFLLISPQGRAAQIVVEGRGRPEDRISEFRNLVETARWKEEPTKVP